MSLFNLGKMRAQQAATPTRMGPMLSPDAIPALLTKTDIPADFQRYEFGEVVKQTFACRTRTGEAVSCPGMIVEMVGRTMSDDGAYADLTIQASLKDLKDSNHPQATMVEEKLNGIYYEKLYDAQAGAAKPDKAPTTQTALSAVTAGVKQAAPPKYQQQNII